MEAYVGLGNDIHPFAPHPAPNRNALFVVRKPEVYTRAGLELARATFVNVKGQIVYDELVRPT